MERHLRKQHLEDGKAFACEHCGKSFALKSNLVIHQKTHDLDKPFGCDKCEKTYKQRNSLREHVLKSHDNISKFICVTCFEKFPSRHLLKVIIVLFTHYDTLIKYRISLNSFPPFIYLKGNTVSTMDVRSI